jgi:hypothetical protein
MCDTTPRFFPLRWNLANNFCQRWLRMEILLILVSFEAWDDRHVTPHLLYENDGIKKKIPQ